MQERMERIEVKLKEMDRVVARCVAYLFHVPESLNVSAARQSPTPTVPFRKLEVASPTECGPYRTRGWPSRLRQLRQSAYPRT